MSCSDDIEWQRPQLMIPSDDRHHDEPNAPGIDVVVTKANQAGTGDGPS